MPTHFLCSFPPQSFLGNMNSLGEGRECQHSWHIPCCSRTFTLLFLSNSCLIAMVKPLGTASNPVCAFFQLTILAYSPFLDHYRIFNLCVTMVTAVSSPWIYCHGNSHLMVFLCVLSYSWHFSHSGTFKQGCGAFAATFVTSRPPKTGHYTRCQVSMVAHSNRPVRHIKPVVYGVRAG